MTAGLIAIRSTLPRLKKAMSTLQQRFFMTLFIVY